MKVIVGCEFSGRVRDAFIAKGHDAVSCDLQPSESLRGPHVQGDVRDALRGESWDLAVLHPPCTHTAISGARWFKAKAPEQEAALAFIGEVWSLAPVKAALEQPMSVSHRVLGPVSPGRPALAVRPRRDQGDLPVAARPSGPEANGRRGRPGGQGPQDEPARREGHAIAQAVPDVPRHRGGHGRPVGSRWGPPLLRQTGGTAMKRLGYADPPYVGCCALYGHFHPDGKCWDDLDTTFQLLGRLNAEFDGWVLCLKSDATELSALIQRAGPGVRVGAWVKPFASFKPNVNPGFCWEPVLFKVGKRDRFEPTVRDFCSANITMKKGLPGAKPEEFNRWVLDLLGAKPGDEVVDLFPGTGGLGKVWTELSSPVCSNAACTVPRHAGPCIIVEVAG